MIIEFILFLLTLLVGYYLGTKRNIKEDLSTTYTHARKEIRKLTEEELKVGSIHRPTHQQIASSQIPDKQKDGLKAMENTLKDIPELNI